MKIIATTIVAAALTFSASAQSSVSTYCRALSLFANEAAEVRDEGHSEQAARSAIGTGEQVVTNHLNAVISYVYARPHLDPAVEASEVFEACMIFQGTAL